MVLRKNFIYFFHLIEILVSSLLSNVLVEYRHLFAQTFFVAQWECQNVINSAGSVYLCHTN